MIIAYFEALQTFYIRLLNEAKIDQLCNTAGEIKKPLIYIGIFK